MGSGSGTQWNAICRCAIRSTGRHRRRCERLRWRHPVGVLASHKHDRSFPSPHVWHSRVPNMTLFAEHSLNRRRPHRPSRRPAELSDHRHRSRQDRPKGIAEYDRLRASSRLSPTDSSRNPGADGVGCTRQHGPSDWASSPSPGRFAVSEPRQRPHEHRRRAVLGKTECTDYRAVGRTPWGTVGGDPTPGQVSPARPRAGTARDSRRWPWPDSRRRWGADDLRCHTVAGTGVDWTDP